jgi:ubiquinone/menaquinone biosynthesis C-methylase UbiE
LKVYEVSTETLFVGRQDAMQRHALIPLSQHFGGSSGGEGKKLLEIACGTGRSVFLHFTFYIETLSYK